MKGYTPEKIEDLGFNEIFVFGSNMNGFHKAGAARVALENFGAEYGNPEGLQGKSYALPTLTKKMKKLPIDELAACIGRLRTCIEKNKHKNFFVTKAGCGIAGFTVDEIKPFFQDFVSLPNVYLPKEFLL